MHATGSLWGRRGVAFAIEIKHFLLPVRHPTFFKSMCQFGGGDTESSDRQDHGANTDVGLRGFANVPTVRTPDHGATDVPLGPNAMQHRVQFIAQLDDGVEGHALMPLGAQPLNHFRKPDSLRIAGGHV
jgi:hypothetical protein